jgi:hypothetical protein
VTLQPDQSALTLTAPTGLANGEQVTLTASLTEDGETALAGRPITFVVGDGVTSQTCTVNTASSGIAQCVILVDQPLGPVTLAAAFAGDDYDVPAHATATTIAFGYLATGAFVVSDATAAVGDTVTLWGPQWCERNATIASCPSAFKGYASSVDPAPYIDATTWSAAPGASGNPPSSVPEYMAVITTSSVTKQGSTISGTITHVVIVRVATTTVSPGATLVGEVVAVLS